MQKVKKDFYHADHDHWGEVKNNIPEILIFYPSSKTLPFQI
jgi:hypothetical protein